MAIVNSLNWLNINRLGSKELIGNTCNPNKCRRPSAIDEEDHIYGKLHFLYPFVKKTKTILFALMEVKVEQEKKKVLL